MFCVRLVLGLPDLTGAVRPVGRRKPLRDPEQAQKAIVVSPSGDKISSPNLNRSVSFVTVIHDTLFWTKEIEIKTSILFGPKLGMSFVKWNVILVKQ